VTDHHADPSPITFLTTGSETRPLATELNEVLERENPHVAAMLSDLGRRLFFPKGILAQSAEAKQKADKNNATIGIALEQRKPMHLAAVMQYFQGLEARDVLPYAPGLGRPDLRQAWRDRLLVKNPSLQGKSFSLPIVTSGVTHAISLVADLFLDPGDTVLMPDKFWENYDLLFGVRYAAKLGVFPFFTPDGGFDNQAFRKALAARAGCDKTLVVLNFPNNPTGYSITRSEAVEIVQVLGEAAENGNRMVVVTDDAYFGLNYEDQVQDESLFALLAGLHERLLAIKVDGPTKEHFVWGFRTGMLTFSGKALQDDAALYQALEKKTAGAIRSSISNCAAPSQAIMARVLADPDLDSQQAAKKEILQARAIRTHQVLASDKYADVWEAYPFNSGYFMCLRLRTVDAETFRKHLLEKYGVGVIADGTSDIRVAFSSVEEAELEAMFEAMAAAARDLV
jgi:aspartate/methionine/tyrosine aminotransferase